RAQKDVEYRAARDPIGEHTADEQRRYRLREKEGKHRERFGWAELDLGNRDSDERERQNYIESGENARSAQPDDVLLFHKIPRFFYSEVFSENLPYHRIYHIFSRMATV